MMPRYISASTNDIITFTSDNGDKFEGELVYDPGYEFSCDHCGTEMEDSKSGYWKDDVRYCAHCAWDLFDQPEPISAYDIWRKEKDEQARLEQERLSVAEDERRRIREEREEQERQYQKEREEEIEEYRVWRESQDVERKKNAILLNNILAKQESARLQERERLREEKFDREEDIESTRLTCEYTGPEEHDPKYDYDSLLEENVVNTRSYDWDPKPPSYDYDSLLDERVVNTRSYDWDPNPYFEDSQLSREYYHLQHDLLEDDLIVEDDLLVGDDIIEENDLLVGDAIIEENDLLPGSIEELYRYLDEQFKSQEVVSIVPDDAIKLDEVFIYCETYDQAKEAVTDVTCRKNDVTQLLPDNSYNISQHNGRFWFKLSPIQGNPTKFSVSVFASKDEVATKYLKRQLEECIYRVDYLLNPEDYRGHRCDDSDAEEEVYPDNWGQIEEPCFVCKEVNYLHRMCAFRGSIVICDACYPTVKQCTECETITQDQTYYNFDTGARLCFDCNFKTKERVQMPLEEHLLVRRDIQHLRRQYFDVLVDYAELAEFTIFDAYRYKSKCHFYDCIQRMSPSGWCAEETLSFCCRRHLEHADEVGCHCTNVWNGTDYDDHYEEATCKICNSPHKTNVASRKALSESSDGFRPIVSAICMFNEISMSDVLFTSLVDLREYFV
jgi:hypothetical protein